MVHPSKKTPEILDEILARLSKGEPLAVICRESDAMPSVQTWKNWCDADETLSIAYARAREAGEDVIGAEVLEIIDETPATFATEHGRRIDPAGVQHQRNRAELRLKLLAKWNPKRWGTKIDHDHAGGLVVTIAAEVAGVG